ncbi:chlorinating enzyme [Salinisphaera hydrothermalis EPR70]
MRFIPGSHKKFYYDERKETSAGRVGLYDHTKTDSGFFGYNFEDFKIDPDWDPEKSGPIDMEMRPGEAVIFTASCVHGSTPNRTERETRLAISGRYVPTHVRVYPGLDKYKAHGEEFDLTQYATVLVSGEDHYEHNKIRAENNHGQKFRRYGA